MASWQTRRAQEARTRQLDFSAADRLQALKVDQRLRAEAAWENTSRFKAQSGAYQRRTPHSADDAADEALERRRRALADKLAIEEAQLRELFVQPETVQLAARRQEMLELARQRAAARDDARLQMAEQKERERYARDSEMLRQLEAAQLQHAVAAAQDQQRAAARSRRMQDAVDARHWSEVEQGMVQRQHLRQLEERAQKDALAAEHASNLEIEMQQHKAAHREQQNQKLQETMQQRQQWEVDKMAHQQEVWESQTAKAQRMAEALASERQRQAQLCAQAAAERETENRELADILRQEETQAAAEMAQKQQARLHEIQYRRQLEDQLERQQVADKHTHDEQLQEAHRQAAALDAQQAAAEAARRRLADEVQAFQRMQIKEHSLARVQQAHHNAQETQEILQRDTAAARAATERNNQIREQDQQHWAAVQVACSFTQLCSCPHSLPAIPSCVCILLQAAPAVNRNYGYKKSQLF